MPNGLSHEHFRSLFDPFGSVQVSPVLISLPTGDVFRWVVVNNAQIATAVKMAMHGSVVDAEPLVVCGALRPGRTLWLLGKEVEGDDERLGLGTVHGHPSPPPQARAAPKKMPVPRMLQPVVVAPTSVLPRIREHDENFAPNSEPGAMQASPDDSTETIVQVGAPLAAIAPPTSSWANIASASDPETRVINLHPTHRVRSGPRLHPAGRIPSPHSNEEPMIEQGRLIFLLSLPNNISLADITSAIREGPVAKIQFGIDQDEKTRFAGIIFLYARDAEAFYSVLCKERVDSRPGRFRFIVDAVRGDPFPADDTIKAMSMHPWATRRLTIVKGRFFFMHSLRWLEDFVTKIAGEANVQLVWIYNGGNATAVFADVASAIQVKRALDRRASAAKKGSEDPWDGLQTTFSKDPCIHALDLRTTMQ